MSIARLADMVLTPCKRAASEAVIYASPGRRPRFLKSVSIKPARRAIELELALEIACIVVSIRALG